MSTATAPGQPQVTEKAAPTAQNESAPTNPTKKKRKYSRGMRTPQVIGRASLKALRRVTNAVADGVEEFHDRQEASALKKRNGAVRDAMKNWSKAVDTTIKESARVPRDLAKAFDGKFARRVARAVMRAMTPPFMR